MTDSFGEAAGQSKQTCEPLQSQLCCSLSSLWLLVELDQMLLMWASLAAGKVDLVLVGAVHHGLCKCSVKGSLYYCSLLTLSVLGLLLLYTSHVKISSPQTDLKAWTCKATPHY